MNEDSRELKSRIVQLADEQLLEMVTTAAGEYRKEAIDYAKAELKARGIDFNKAAGNKAAIDETPQDEESVEPIVSTRGSLSECLACGGRLRSGTLVAEKELTIVFSDNLEERFVRVTACTQCGQVSLVADYATDVEP